MPSRLLLVRHGASAHVHDGQWHHRRTVSEFEDAYDAAGILESSQPPASLRNEARAADLICASDLPRAIASAERIAPGRQVVLTPLLREIRLEPPRLIPVALPIAVWDYLSHAQWSYRLLTGRDHQFVRRAEAAAEWLQQHALTCSSIVAVTHAGFRRIISDRLMAQGWKYTDAPRSFAHWSIWELRRS